ncbi:NAD(P)/FAD-dependent oxidoreductase [Streptomyces hoynatensis]|uniref:NAD(P)/FAD-dependent oxidoreductase n=1 Tax=Streptomyces hoynatensis TaxID=1141874 RepID=A0A3A9YWB2_9ACTN|nr:NAD(P)/FAD-dependent oxidoreductase [Streptomyces hoynatensis]RKN39507.1 NAD(P)/FAD-dependent oxidoreductase [Streptomyces hoynatensis]
MGEQFDVVVVGARVAGSPLAALLARRGVKVAVLEQATHLRPVLSSHLIQSDALAFLDRLGVIDKVRATGAPFLTHTDNTLEDLRFIEEFPLTPGSVGGAANIRRRTLDPIVMSAAVDAGAQVRLGTKVTDLLWDHKGRVSGVRATRNGITYDISARLVVGADGRGSTVAKRVGSRKYNITTNERGYYWTYFEGADLSGTPTFVLHRVGDRHIFGAPSDNGLYIVGVSPEAHEKEAFRADTEGMLMKHAESCEPIAKRIAGARIATKIYGIIHFNGYFAEPAGPGWVLVGDAGHFKDPSVGRGIGDAFHQADELAPRLVKALRGTDADVDRATAKFGRWRDRTFAQFYWLAADVGRVGPLPGVVVDVVKRLHEKGRIDTFLKLYNHEADLTDLVTPGNLLGVTGRHLLPPARGRGAFFAELGSTLRTQAVRVWRNRRPVYGSLTTEGRLS